MLMHEILKFSKEALPMAQPSISPSAGQERFGRSIC